MIERSHLHATLELEEVRVLVGGKLVVGALLNDLALVYDEKQLAVPDGAQSVRDNNRSSALHGPVQCLLHNFLALLVKR